MKRRPSVEPPWKTTKEEMLASCPMQREREDVLHETRETVPLDPEAIGTVAEFLQAARRIGFQGHQLGRAYETWLDMLQDPECLIFLGISGAVVPAGLGRLLSRMIRANTVDVIVTTGAQAYHDLHEASGGYHYHVQAEGDDDALRDMSIDRFYNVATDDIDFHALDDCIADKLSTLADGKPHSTREVMDRLAEIAIHDDTFVKSAVDCGKPIFVPTFHDSSLSFGPTKTYCDTGRAVQIDFLRDNAEIVSVARTAKRLGAVFIGGGVPKNYIQQIVPLTEIVDEKVAHGGGLTYGVQFTTADVRDGGLSGCSMSESKTWGKYHEGSQMIQVWGEATITFSMVATGVHQSRERFANRPRRRFTWPTADPLGVHIQTTDA